MTLGTLRNQVIYPDSKEDMLKKGYTDKHLEDILSKVIEFYHNQSSCLSIMFNHDA